MIYFTGRDGRLHFAQHMIEETVLVNIVVCGARCAGMISQQSLIDFEGMSSLSAFRPFMFSLLQSHTDTVISHGTQSMSQCLQSQ